MELSRFASGACLAVLLAGCGGRDPVAFTFGADHGGAWRGVRSLEPGLADFALTAEGASTLETDGLTPFRATTHCRRRDPLECEEAHRQHATWTVRWTSDQRIPKGSELFFLHDVSWRGITYNVTTLDLNQPKQYWPLGQTTHPSKPEFVSFRSSLPQAFKAVPDASLSEVRKGWKLVSKRGVPAGTVIDFTFGDSTGGSPGMIVPPFPVETRWQLYKRAQGESGQSPVHGASFTTRVVGWQTGWVKVTAPSFVSLGDAFEVHIHVMHGEDSFDANGFENELFEGTVTVDAGPGTPSRTIFFRPVDGGIRTVQMTARQEGILRMRASTGAVEGWSNPIRVGTGPSSGPWWGSIHNHTVVGHHATAVPEFAYAYARRIAHLDFFALSEHAESTQLRWEDLRALAEHHHQDGAFVVFPAYEWTNFNQGHRHAIFPGTGQVDPVRARVHMEGIDTDPVPFVGDVAPFLEHVQSQGGLPILHHSLLMKPGRGIVVEPIDQAHSSLFEIYSWHGSSESADADLPPHHKPVPKALRDFGYRELLAEGRELRITSDGDNHMGRAGSNIAVGVMYSRMGLTAAYAPQQTRSGIFRALKEGRSYGTTGARMLVDFQVSDTVLGGTGRVGEAPQLRLEVHGTDRVVEVSFWRDGTELAYIEDPSALDAVVTFTDTSVQPRTEVSYYARVVQADGHHAWTSPIWIRRTSR